MLFSLFFLLLGDESEMEFDNLNIRVVLVKLFFIELDDDFLLKSSMILYNLLFWESFLLKSAVSNERKSIDFLNSCLISSWLQC